MRSTSRLERERAEIQATNAAVKKKALGYIKAWAKQFEDTKDPNLGMMGELYDQLRAKGEITCPPSFSLWHRS